MFGRMHRHCQERRFVRGGFGFGHSRHGMERHGAGGGRRGRVFDYGDLRLVILALIAEKPRHGYELIKAIEEKVAGAYSPSPGVVYPTLTMLEELGYVTVSANDGPKKLYETTEAGREFLEANKASVDALFQRMAAANEAAGGGPAPQIIRAMENLRMALRMRLTRGPLTEEQVRAIAKLLDETTVQVEQL
jgi:DNA-binding PadR family transcriptional regulator